MGAAISPIQEAENRVCYPLRYLIVSIHDVTPKFYTQIEEIINRLQKIRVDKTNLLLVPDWLPNSKPHENDLRRHPKFVDFLKDLNKNGFSFAQHGLYHKSLKRKGCYKGPVQYVMGEYIAIGLAEMQNLNYPETMQVINQGQKIFTETGLEAKGCVPPWWQASPAAISAIIESRKFDYYMATDFWHLFGRFSTVPITDLKSRQTHISRELCFEPRDKLADYFTRGLEWLVTRCEQASVIRFGIHPSDVENEELFNHILGRIEEVKQERELVTYPELLDKKYRLAA